MACAVLCASLCVNVSVAAPKHAPVVVSDEPTRAEAQTVATFAMEPPTATQGIDTLASVACRPALRDAVLQGAAVVQRAACCSYHVPALRTSHNARRCRLVCQLLLS